MFIPPAVTPRDIGNFSQALACPLYRTPLIDAVMLTPCGHSISEAAARTMYRGESNEPATCSLCSQDVKACYPNLTVRSLRELLPEAEGLASTTSCDISNFSRALECPIHYTPLLDAVMLTPCGHTFSEAAARRMYRGVRDDATPKGTCSFCSRDVKAYYPNLAVRSLTEMALRISGWRPYDPKWGALLTNLQDEGYSPSQIEEAKTLLTSTIKNPSTPITAEIQALYAKVFPKNRKELILEIKEELLAFTEARIRNILENSPEPITIQRELRELLQADSYIEEKLRALWQLGECESVNWYFYHCCSSYSAEERKAKAEAIVEEVVRNFFDGTPTSFPMMAHILGERKTAYSSISHLSPISDIPQSMQILSRLADLGEKEAQSKLSWVYTYNKIGSDQDEVDLNLTKEKRLEELRRLALAGHAWSQYELGNACYHQALGRDSISGILTEEVRRKYIQELWDCEVPHNYYLQAIVKDNRIGDLPYGLSLENRLNILHDRAQKGDKEAFSTLFSSYTNNRMGRDKDGDSLNLTQTARMEKLKELRAYNQKFFDAHMTNVYRDNRAGDAPDFLEPNFSDHERIEWLEDQALYQNNSRARNVLAEAYAKNRLSSHTRRPIPLQMPLEERIEKLRTIADKDCHDAQFILLQYYELNCWENTPTVTRGSPDSALQTPQVSSAVVFQDVLRWALLGNKNGAQNQILLMSGNAMKRDALKFLFSVRLAMLT